MVDLTSVILSVRLSEWETGVGNLPAVQFVSVLFPLPSLLLQARRLDDGVLRTLGQTRTQETGNLLDQGVGSDEGIVLAGELLDELLVLVQLLQVVGGHGVDTAVLGTVDIVLVTQDADAHVGARDRGQLDGARETLVTLRVIVLEADLELDSLEEVPLLLSPVSSSSEVEVEGKIVEVATHEAGEEVLTSSNRGAQRRSDALRRP